MLPGLKHARVAKGVTQEELSSSSGVHRDTIQKIETNQRPARPGTLRKLAEALGVEPEELAAERKEGSPRMSNERMVRVPERYPTFEDTNFAKDFDGSEDAWLWNSLRDLKEHAMVESLVQIIFVRGGEGVDLPGLMSSLWGVLEDTAEEFIEANREEIERRVKALEERER